MAKAGFRRFCSVRYQARIEIFFKWIKQNLRIRRFLGKSQNAVETQIFIALIACLLISLAHAGQTVIAPASAFAKLLAMNLWEKRKTTALTDPTPTMHGDPRQTAMAFLNA